MFGYVRVNRPECRIREYEYYRGVYCGLCRSIGRCTGQCARMALGYDLAFMAVARLALEGLTPTLEPSRCIAHPLRRRLMARPAAGSREEEIFSLCACANTLLSYYKLCDDVADEKGLRRLGARMVRLLGARAYRRARRRYGALDDLLREGLSALSEAEKQNVESVDQPAELFGRILGGILSFGLADGARRIAYDVGFHIGKWVYMVDAADDYAEDVKRGRFNPLARSWGEAWSEADRASFGEALTAELMAAERGLDLLDYPDENARGVIENIMYSGMPAVAKRVLDGRGKEKEGRNERSL